MKVTIEDLMYHYNRVRQDMDTRRTRKNGWNDIISAYMGKLPANWPFLAVTTDPRIRTAILEKTARLLNSKLRGRLVPRNSGSVIKANINNALLEFQWDYANEGGSMIEKVAMTDQTTRWAGAGFVFVYWDVNKNTNEIKPIDPRDIGFDGAATHIRNARWVQIREFTTWDRLEARGYNVKKFKRMAKEGELTSQWRSGSYDDVVKANRGLQDRVGEYDDPTNPIVEVVTEWRPDKCVIFLPRYSGIVDESPNPYKHGKIPVAQLRYYPLGSDIYGESEVESVLPLQRAINSTLCGFIDEMTISMRPPLKIIPSQVRIETIQYGPGAQWIVQNPNAVTEAQLGSQVVANFNATYPALVAAFNTAMGDNSLGVSNVRGQFTQKTATEVESLSQQQNSRDQYNQLYLSEFLKDIMMMWVANNKQYLFDDPTKKYHILKIIGKDQIQYFQQMQLDDKDVPDDVMREITQTIGMNPNAVSDQQLQDLISDVSVPKNPVILNPEEKDPQNYQIKSKLDVTKGGEEADLYITPDDFDGEYDYIPDVQSMASGALQSQKEARTEAITLMTQPQVMQLLAQEGYMPRMKEILESKFKDAGERDTEGLFQPINNGQTQSAGLGAPQAGPGLTVPFSPPGMGQVPQAVPNPASPGGIPRPIGIPGQA